LAKYGIGTILDYSVEGEKTEAGFEKTTEEIILTIEKARQSNNLPFCVFKATGVASAEIFEKVQRKAQLNQEEQAAFEKIRARVNRICAKAF
jgi:proline dehydrogenase